MSEKEAGARSAWYSPNVPGLKRRHVKSIHVEYEDAPPPSIAEERLEDIVRAMKLGFNEMQAHLGKR